MIRKLFTGYFTLRVDWRFLLWLLNWDLQIGSKITTAMEMYGSLSFYDLYGISEHKRGSRGRDRMIVGFTTTCVICAYHH